MIISKNLRVYNTRVRSDCQVKKGHSQKFALPLYSLSNGRACITAWKRLECIAEKMSLLALGPVILGEIQGLISYLIYLPNTWTSHAKGNGIAHNVRVCGA